MRENCYNPKLCYDYSICQDEFFQSVHHYLDGHVFTIIYKRSARNEQLTYEKALKIMNSKLHLVPIEYRTISRPNTGSRHIHQHLFPLFHLNQDRFPLLLVFIIIPISTFISGRSVRINNENFNEIRQNE